MHATAETVIAQLGLARLPREGGYFRQTWRTAAGSAIYYLMTRGEFSAFHRLRADEVWHFYAGDPVEHVRLDPESGAAIVTLLGNAFAWSASDSGAAPAFGESPPEARAMFEPQLIVPANVWQAARIASGAATFGWSLLGCTLAPAWREEEFELAEADALHRSFPRAAEYVRALTR